MPRRWGCSGRVIASLEHDGMNGVFTNPMAAPYLFGNVYPMSSGQIGAMMLANQTE